MATNPQLHGAGYPLPLQDFQFTPINGSNSIHVALILPNGNLGTSDPRQAFDNSSNMISTLGSRAQDRQNLQAHNSNYPVARIGFLGCSSSVQHEHHNVRPKNGWIIARTGNKLGSLNAFLKSTTTFAGQQIDGDAVIGALEKFSINGNQIVLSETLPLKVDLADNALVPTNYAASTTQSIGTDRPKKGLRGNVRGPTPTIPIPALEHMEWKLYIITPSGVLVQTIDHISPFRAIRREPKRGFPRFAYLPAELRTKIWQHAIPEARTVYLETLYAGERRSDFFLRPYGERVPGILQSCRESRFWALKTLTPAFKPNYPNMVGRAAYVNFDHDTIALSIEAAQLLAESNDPNIVGHRQRVRGLICYTDLLGFTVTRTVVTVLTLVLTSAIGPWNEVQTWSFPGICEQEVGQFYVVDWICFQLPRPKDRESVKKELKSQAESIEDELWRVFQLYPRVGIRITFSEKRLTPRIVRATENIQNLMW